MPGTNGFGMFGAIKTIANMVLISLSPFTYRKILLIAVALLGLSAVCFADPVLMAQRYRPNHGGPSVPQAMAPTGYQSEKLAKMLMVGPELGALDARDLVRDESEWRSTPLLANLLLSPAESSFGLLQRDADTAPERFISGMAAAALLR